MYVSSQQRSTVKIIHSKFAENSGVAVIIHGNNTYTSIIHSEFINNNVKDSTVLADGLLQTSSLITLYRTVIITITLQKLRGDITPEMGVVHPTSKSLQWSEITIG